MGSFKDFLKGAAPSWLLNPKGEAWMRGLGDGKDAALARLKEAVKARFTRFAPPDALLQIGIERQLGRARTDDDATYAARLQNAWNLWPWAGTATGVLGALFDQGYTNAQLVIAKGKIYSMNASRELVITDAPDGAFTFDPPSFWTKFILFFPNPQIQRWQDDGVPADGSDEALAVIALVKKWKSAHSFFERAVIEDTGELWGIPPEGTWGDPGGTWGGTSITWTVPN